jgi:hypothetical protein
MRKTILAAALGIVVSVAPSYGQGYIFFNNYGTTTDAIVTLRTCCGFPYYDGPVPSSYTAGLLYSIGAFDSLHDLGVRQAFNPLTPGYFQGPIVTILRYSGGPITFQVFVDDGFGIRGYSTPFTLPSIATGTQPVGEFGPSLQPFGIVYIPEPSTIALVGFGLVSLLIFRRQRS